MSKPHGHEDAYHDSNYSQVCTCGAVRLRASGSREWGPWHTCGLCAPRPAHEANYANGRRK